MKMPVLGDGYGYEARPVPNMVQGPFGLKVRGYVKVLRPIS